jgi:hypothetical protein
MNFTNAPRWKGTHRALDHILTIDAIAIDALLLEVLRDPTRYRCLLKRCDHEAQSLLDLLQAVSRSFSTPMSVYNANS